jgi:integrase
MNKREEILNAHKEHRSIWFNESNKRWCTKLGEDKKKVMRKNREDLENAIVEYYLKKSSAQPSFSDVFQNWTEFAEEHNTVKMKTINEYTNDYNRFLKNNTFASIPMNEISEKNIVKLLSSLVYSKEKITSKRFSSVKTIIRTVFNHAKIEMDIDCICVVSIMNDLKFSNGSFKDNTKPNSEQVFKKSEIMLIKQYLSNTSDLEELGILLTIETGLRIGELATLKREDLTGNDLHINRSEHKASFKDGYKYFIGLPKGDKTRIVKLSDDALYVIDKITSLHTSEWLFPSKECLSTWNRSYNFDDAIRRVCREINIPVRSMHKLRKTYASYLLSVGKPEKLVQQQLGHSDIRTTQRAYHYNIFDDDEINNEFKNISVGA